MLRSYPDIQGIRLDQSLQQRYHLIQKRVENCSAKHLSSKKKVVILGASKQQSVEAIRQLYDLGITHFGENYVQDALPKIHSTADTKITWHYIGSVQANKTKLIATHFDWVQSVDRLRIADRLDQARSQLQDNEPLNVCIEVNVNNEPSKSGIPITEVHDFVKSLKQFKSLRPRGLMAIPGASSDVQETRQTFRRLYELFATCRTPENPQWDTLSMGMSADYHIAITEGATMVRLGTALFGPRK